MPDQVQKLPKIFGSRPPELRLLKLAFKTLLLGPDRFISHASKHELAKWTYRCDPLRSCLIIFLLF
jgi:hypothetical protein